MTSVLEPVGSWREEFASHVALAHPYLQRVRESADDADRRRLAAQLYACFAYTSPCYEALLPRATTAAMKRWIVGELGRLWCDAPDLRGEFHRVLESLDVDARADRLVLEPETARAVVHALRIADDASLPEAVGAIGLATGWVFAAAVEALALDANASATVLAWTAALESLSAVLSEFDDAARGPIERGIASTLSAYEAVWDALADRAEQTELGVGDDADTMTLADLDESLAGL